MGDNQVDLYTGTKPLRWKILGSGTRHSRSVAAYISQQVRGNYARKID